MTVESLKLESLVIVVLLFAVLVLAVACGDAPAVAPEPRPSTAVAVEAVAPRPVAPTLRVPGVVEARSRIELPFRVTGFVERFAVDEGDRVEAGDVLAVLETDELERQVRAAAAAARRAAAAAADASRTFERQRELFARSSTSQQSYDTAQSARAMARAEHAEAAVRLETAQDRLAKATLRAPVAGVVEKRLLEAHELAAAQSPVLVLAELDTVKVRAAVADAHLARLGVGRLAAVRTPLWPGRTFEGKVARIDVAADPATRTVPFEVELANPDLALRPQLVVEVELRLGEPALETLVPLGAVLRHTDTTPFCFVAVATDGTGDLHVERRPVALGPVYGDRVAIARGLEPGDRVVVRGQHFVRDGDPVHLVRD